MTSSDLLSDRVTLRELTRASGRSYFWCYGLGAAGILGEPLKLGNALYFPRATAAAALRERGFELAL